MKFAATVAALALAAVMTGCESTESSTSIAPGALTGANAAEACGASCSAESCCSEKVAPGAVSEGACSAKSECSAAVAPGAVSEGACSAKSECSSAVAPGAVSEGACSSKTECSSAVAPGAVSEGECSAAKSSCSTDLPAMGAVAGSGCCPGA